MLKFRITTNLKSFSVSILVIGSLLFLGLPAFGQEVDQDFLTVSDHEFQPDELSLKVDAMAFFRDNEYDSDVSKGYTLPGAWLNPAVQYNPLQDIHLEAGFYGLFFDGANKYPNYVYHDIAKWKGNQYQDGAHVLPWFRAEMKTGKFDFILGDIYGGTEHRFSTPLYNKEQMLSADPEMGAQILFKSRSFKSDLFVNWQSFQFDEDTHQEAFTVGLSAVVSPFHNKDVFFPIAALVNHRGGELDKTSDGVQTIYNGSVGIAWEKDYPAGGFNHLRLESNVLGCYQQTGHLWNFESGVAYNASATMTFFRDIHAEVGYLLAPSDFVSLYGNPYFSTISLKHPEMTYTSANTAYFDFGYSHTWAKDYTFGANLEAFSAHPGGGKSEFVFSFGLYMIVKPEFLLKQFNSK